MQKATKTVQAKPAKTAAKATNKTPKTAAKPANKAVPAKAAAKPELASHGLPERCPTLTNGSSPILLTKRPQAVPLNVNKSVAFLNGADEFLLAGLKKTHGKKAFSRGQLDKARIARLISAGRVAVKAGADTADLYGNNYTLI